MLSTCSKLSRLMIDKKIVRSSWEEANPSEFPEAEPMGVFVGLALLVPHCAEACVRL